VSPPLLVERSDDAARVAAASLSAEIRGKASAVMASVSRSHPAPEPDTTPSSLDVSVCNPWQVACVSITERLDGFASLAMTIRGPAKKFLTRRQ
jgi:hypothetical protein